MDDDDTMSGAARSWFQPMAQMTAQIVIVTLTRPTLASPKFWSNLEIHKQQTIGQRV